MLLKSFGGYRKGHQSLFCVVELNSRCKLGFGQSGHPTFLLRNKSSPSDFPSFQLSRKFLSAETVLEYLEKVENIERLSIRLFLMPE